MSARRAFSRIVQVWRVPLLDDGSVSKVGAFFSSHGPSGSVLRATLDAPGLPIHRARVA